MKPNLARVLAEGFRWRIEGHERWAIVKTPTNVIAHKAMLKGYDHADRLMK